MQYDDKLIEMEMVGYVSRNRVPNPSYRSPNAQRVPSDQIT
jgi:hypothetical protein